MAEKLQPAPNSAAIRNITSGIQIMTTHSPNLKKTGKYLLFTSILLLPVALYCIPIECITTGKSICLYKNVFGKECFGCGITRAIFCALHCDFQNALSHNKLITVVFPLLIYLWLKKLLQLFPGNLLKSKQ